MKKVFFLLIITLITTSTLHASNFRWKKIVDTADGTTEFYINKLSVKKVGKFHYYWGLGNYLILEDGQDEYVRSTIFFNIIDCKESAYKTVIFTSYSLNMGRGEIIDDIVIPDEDITYFDWNYFGPKTSFGVIAKEVCKTR